MSIGSEAGTILRTALDVKGSAAEKLEETSRLKSRKKSAADELGLDVTASMPEHSHNYD